MPARARYWAATAPSAATAAATAAAAGAGFYHHLASTAIAAPCSRSPGWFTGRDTGLEKAGGRLGETCWCYPGHYSSARPPFIPVCLRFLPNAGPGGCGHVFLFRSQSGEPGCCPSGAHIHGSKSCTLQPITVSCSITHLSPTETENRNPSLSTTWCSRSITFGPSPGDAVPRKSYQISQQHSYGCRNMTRLECSSIFSSPT